MGQAEPQLIVAVCGDANFLRSDLGHHGHDDKSFHRHPSHARNVYSMII